MHHDTDARSTCLLSLAAEAMPHQKSASSPQSSDTLSKDSLPVLRHPQKDKSTHKSRTTYACKCPFELNHQVYSVYIMQIITLSAVLTQNLYQLVTLYLKELPTYKLSTLPSMIHSEIQLPCQCLYNPLTLHFPFI